MRRRLQKSLARAEVKVPSTSHQLVNTHKDISFSCPRGRQLNAKYYFMVGGMTYADAMIILMAAAYLYDTHDRGRADTPGPIRHYRDFDALDVKGFDKLR